MRRFLLAVFLSVAAGAAHAAAYDDFARGLAANQRGDTVLALASFSSAIAAGDLSAALLPQAYRGRAIAYLRDDKCALALADVEAALKLKPDDIDSLAVRAGAHNCGGDLAAALADYSAIIVKTPLAAAYGSRGRLHWRMGDFAGAADDFAQQVRLTAKDSYAVLWLEMSRQRAGTFDAAVAAKDVDRLDTRHWPAPLLSLYTGDATPDEVDRAAARPDTEAADLQLCEADLYVGEWLLGKQDTATARARLQRAADRCPRRYASRYAAVNELGRLK